MKAKHITIGGGLSALLVLAGTKAVEIASAKIEASVATKEEKKAIVRDDDNAQYLLDAIERISTLEKQVKELKAER